LIKEHERAQGIRKNPSDPREHEKNAFIQKKKRVFPSSHANMSIGKMSASLVDLHRKSVNRILESKGGKSFKNFAFPPPSLPPSPQFCLQRWLNPRLRKYIRVATTSKREKKGKQFSLGKTDPRIQT